MDDKQREAMARLREEYGMQLRQEREALVAEAAEGEADLRPAESERANELEERAQQADATRMFIHLDQRRKQRIDEIDQVLQRIALGTYGLCDRCGKLIPIARLRALPTARVHVQCADEEEGILPPNSEGEETLSAEVDLFTATEPEEEVPEGSEAEERAERMPLDIGSLSDEEVEESLREQLEEDGRVDLHELRITYSSGVLTLEGALPSEEQHQMVLQYATDFSGIQDIVDHVMIDELLWEREDRTAPPEDEEAAPGTLAGAMEELLESDQEDRSYEPPDRPVREET